MGLFKRLIVLVVLFTSSAIFGQSSLHLYTGVVNGFGKDKIFTESGTGHFGYAAGLEFKSNADELYLLFNGEYGQLNLLSTKFNYFSGDNINVIKYKVGVGVDLKKLKNKKVLRARVQGTLSSLSGVDSTILQKRPALKTAGYESVNENLAGLATGLGIFGKRWSVELAYEAGLFNIISDKKDTRINSISLFVGYRLF
jgi:hypothetical protein